MGQDLRRIVMKNFLHDFQLVEGAYELEKVKGNLIGLGNINE